jgi:hypothetical protein
MHAIDWIADITFFFFVMSLVPVYDGRFTGFDASVDIDNIDKILPVYEGDIPANCCTAVGYTISHYVTRTREDHISFNLQWAIVLGEPEE